MVNVPYVKTYSDKLLVLLVVVTLLKGILYSVIVPVWEFPDEQAHFAQVSRLIEFGHQFTLLDTSREVYELERVMGTARDERGINHYTYEVGFRPSYSRTTQGIYESYIQRLPQSYRTEFVVREAAKYPPLFYLLSGLGYRLVYGSDIFTRVFFTRLVSVVLSGVSVVIMFLIGQQLFKREFIAVVLATLLSFHPMFSFVSAGINNDNLTNLWGLVLIWLVLVMLKKGMTYRLSLGIGLVSGLAILTKPLILPLLIGVGFVILLEWWISKRSWKQQSKQLLPLVIGGVCAGGWLILKPLIQNGRLPYFAEQKEYGLPDLTFTAYIGPKLSQYYRETLVWYWGVFKWLGVILPLWLIRLIKIVMGIAGVGVAVELLKNKKTPSKTQLMSLIILGVTFIVSLTLWDYHGFRSNGFSYGLQGRYFFPTIGTHLALILVGVLAFIPQQFKLMGAKVSALVMIGAQLISWKVLIKAYYATESVAVLFIQMSQYKVWFLKYPYASIWLSLYTIVLGIFVWKLVRYNPRRN